MRNVIAIALFVCAARATAQTPAEIVDRAIKSHGGGEAVAKMKAFERTGKGKYIMVGSEIDAIYEAKLALPERAHFSIELALPAGKVKTVIGLNGLSGWMKTNNDPAKELIPVQFDQMMDESWVHWLCTLAPLTKKGLTLHAAEAVQVEGQAADGVRIVKDGRPDITLYFSKANGLLVRAHAKLKESGVAVSREWTFANHKDVSGVKLPGKVVETQNSTPLATWSSVDYKLVEKFDLAVFRKP